MSVLTLQYRPTRFEDVVGQNHIKPILKAMVKAGDVPPALILGGSRGTGKTTCARILAAALNCSQQGTGDACGMCTACLAVQSTNNLSVLEIDAASTGGVDQIRTVRDLTMYAHDGLWRVVILDEAHSMSKEAFNALLKILEEPPPQTVFVLVTTEVDKILETVRSRSMLFTFRRLSLTDITGRLRHIADTEEIKADDQLVAEIATRVQGGMRDAVMMLDQVRRVGVHDVEGFRELHGIRDVSEELFRAALAYDNAAGSTIIGEQYRRTGDALGMTTDLTLLVRDLLVIKSGGTPEVTVEQLLLRQALAEEVETRQLSAVIKVLWDLKSRVKAFDFDHRAAMEMAFVLIAEALQAPIQQVSTAAPVPKAVQAVPEPTLSLEEIKQLLAS